MSDTRTNVGWSTLVQFPCKDCPDRHLACSDTCRKYQICKAANEILKQRRAQQIEKTALSKHFDVQELKREKDRRGRKRG